MEQMLYFLNIKYKKYIKKYNYIRECKSICSICSIL
nr:MAG TPA: hypothetical protein [Caudoviricetes sp.]